MSYEYTITRETWTSLQEAGLDVTDTYSGRGMYGKTCVGVVGTIADLIRFCGIIAEEVAWIDNTDVAEVLDIIAASAESESMGTGMVFYFQRVGVEQAEV